MSGMPATFSGKSDSMGFVAGLFLHDFVLVSGAGRTAHVGDKAKLAVLAGRRHAVKAVADRIECIDGVRLRTIQSKPNARSFSPTMRHYQKFMK